MMRYVNVAFGAVMLVLICSILGLMVTLFDAVEWQPFFFKSFLGALVLAFVLALIEAAAKWREG